MRTHQHPQGMVAQGQVLGADGLEACRYHGPALGTSWQARLSKTCTLHQDSASKCTQRHRGWLPLTSVTAYLILQQPMGAWLASWSSGDVSTL